MRLFVSIDFPQEIIEYITTVQNQLVAQYLFEGRLTKPEQLHVTLKFLGDIPEEQLPLLKKALDSIHCSSFEVCLGSLGVLLSNKHIRIIWLDIVGDELKKLAKQIHEVLAPFAQPEERDFLSHVTLARVKNIVNREQLRAHLETITIEKRCFSISHFILKQSKLCPEGPEYIDIASYQLDSNKQIVF